MPKDITQTQYYRIYALLDKNPKGLTISQISNITGYPEPSLRRAISDMKKIGRIEKKIIYRLKS